MPLHRSRIKFRGVEYIESSGIDDEGSGVITWSRSGYKSQMIGYYDPTKLPESLEQARKDIEDFIVSLSPDQTKAESEGRPGSPGDEWEAKSAARDRERRGY